MTKKKIKIIQINIRHTHKNSPTNTHTHTHTHTKTESNSIKQSIVIAVISLIILPVTVVLIAMYLNYQKYGYCCQPKDTESLYSHAKSHYTLHPTQTKSVNIHQNTSHQSLSVINNTTINAENISNNDNIMFIQTMFEENETMNTNITNHTQIDDNQPNHTSHACLVLRNAEGKVIVTPCNRQPLSQEN